MPGRSPHEAVHAFLDPLKRAVACVGSAHLTLDRRSAYTVGETHAWVLNRGVEPLEVAGDTNLWLSARMNYEIADRGRSEGDQRFKVRTTAYLYSVGVSGGEEAIAAHWHPTGNSKVDFPHYHIEGPAIADSGVFGSRAHIPSGRVSFEWVIRFMIESMGAYPQCEDWSERLALSESLFRQHRTWE